MSGHSKWASIKHKKAIVDSRRGAHFSKLTRAITVAARDGGGDPVGNPALDLAIRKAKEASMPKDNIERAIAKGTGEGGDADAIEAVLYEGYGPGGVAVLVEALTENRNRTSAEVRHAFTKNDGSLGEPGSVAYLFDKKGTIVIDATRYSEDDLMVAVEAGAEDISTDDDVFEVITEPADFAAVRAALDEAGVEIESAEMAYRASSLVPVEEAVAGKLMRLIELLEDNDDVERRARQLRRVGRRARTCRRVARPPVVILCGGRGTRLQEHTQEIPKPLVEIGGMPIVWHVIALYAAQGFARFLLATGYQGELIERFAAAQSWPAGVEVRCEDTGRRHADRWADRPARAAAGRRGALLRDLRRRARRPRPAGAARLPPRARRGRDDDGRQARAAVRRHRARRRRPRHGLPREAALRALDQRRLLLLRDPRARLHRVGGDSVLEREPLEGLARDGELRAHRHEGFWECMDTYKDAVALNDLWEAGSGAVARGRRSGRQRPCPEQRHAAADALQPPLAGERPAIGVLGGLAQRAVDQQAAGAGDRGDPAGQVDRAPEPVAGARQCRAERGAGAQLRELLALGVGRVDQGERRRTAAARARARRASPRRRSS